MLNLVRSLLLLAFLVAGPGLALLLVFAKIIVFEISLCLTFYNHWHRTSRIHVLPQLKLSSK
jgi:hypothetical protein